MKIAVLGTGTVGRVLASKLASLGHEVRLGSRTADNATAAAWAEQAGGSHGTFADAAAFGELVLACVSGQHVLAVLEAAGADALAGKVLIDVSNPLDFSRGFPPTLSVCNDDSLAERIQRAFPEARVVKALNTVGNHLMVDPGQLADGEHDLLICGDDGAAKGIVTELLQQIGWKHVLDLGDVSNARGTEAWLLLWTRIYASLGHADFNLRIVRKGA